ncbi:MAG: anhydro-N-acetylmuramic acid kinase [Ignavibacteriae bacterium]|nr:MAG: anhydro-N-acetylmuramic acid kinase [Ignavibacteriota bacterium]
MQEKIKIINPGKEKTAIGLLSGTSVDGIDAVLVKIKNSGADTGIKVIDFETYKIPVKIKNKILINSNNSTAKIADICRLNVIIGKLFADAALNICIKNKVKPSSVDFIGSHGQTIHHLPDMTPYEGFKVKSTLQIGDPSIIANVTGITTVGDFRIADCASDGDGAPLVPFLDYILFRNKNVNRGLLNIGGIANITVLPKSCEKDEVFAFDTGPGNMLIDGLMRRLYNKPFDKDGRIALKGKIIKLLFDFLVQDKQYRQRPPKSTGREYYGTEFLNKISRLTRTARKEDVIRTVTEFTAFTISYNYKKFVYPKVKLDEIIVSGGGSYNPVIMNSLQSLLPKVKIVKMNSKGISAESKEAVLFAVLANENLCGNPASMRSVTGAKKDSILGKICLA